MIGIEQIASYVPQNHVDIMKQLNRYGVDEKFVTSKTGALKLPRCLPGQDTSDLAALAIEKLISKSNINLNDISSLICCTQNPDASGLPHTSAIVHNKMGLPNSIAAFDISLGCSGYVYGLKVAEGFLNSIQANNCLLITCDPYSKILDPNDRDTSLLFGDAASATLLSRQGEWKIAAGLFGTDGKGCDYLKNNNGKLYMNGRQIFNFALTKIPSHVKQLLRDCNLTLDDIDSYIFHQGSRFMIEQIMKRLNLPEDKVPIEIENTGNTVSSSIPLLLETRLDNPKFGKLVLSGFGVGLSWGSVLIERNSLR